MISRTIIRQHIETDAADATLERLIRDAFETLATRHRFVLGESGGGDEDTEFSAGDFEETVQAGGGEMLTVTKSPRLLAEVTFSERDSAGEWQALEDADFEKWSTRRYERLTSGPNPSGLWAPQVRVAATINDALVDRVVIDLVRLALMYDATTSERAGDYSHASPDYQKEREAIISTLAPIGVS